MYLSLPIPHAMEQQMCKCSFFHHLVKHFEFTQHTRCVWSQVSWFNIYICLVFFSPQGIELDSLVS